MSIQTKKLNNVIVKPIPLPKKKERKPNNIYDNEFPNMYLLAPKETGKTTVIYNMLQEIADKDTIVIFFCGQINNDPSYRAIINSLNKRKIKHIDHNTFKIDKDKKNELDYLMQLLKSGDLSEVQIEMHASSDNDEEGEDTPPRADDEKYIIIIDDMSDELKTPSLGKLLKENRHMRCTVIISTQYLNNIEPTNLTQMQYILVFSGQSDAKLEELWKKIALDTPLNEFIRIYRYAIDKKPDKPSHNFLFIDKVHSKYRKNFNEEIIINK